MEDIATSPMTGSSEAERLRSLAALDRVPIVQRVEIGYLLIDWLQAVADDPDAVRMRRLGGLPGDVHVAFGVAGRRDQQTFSYWVQLRHHELQQRNGNWTDQITIGVQLTPRHDGHRPWDTTMIGVSGDVGFTAEDLATLRSLFDN